MNTYLYEIHTIADEFLICLHAVIKKEFVLHKVK